MPKKMHVSTMWPDAQVYDDTLGMIHAHVAAVYN